MYLTKGLTVLLVLFCHERTSSPVMIIMSNPPTTPATAPTSSSSRITEICIGCPDEYNGKAEAAQAWLDSVCLYLLINQALYHDNNRKIAYALSYMKKVLCLAWVGMNIDSEACLGFLRTRRTSPSATKGVFLEATPARRCSERGLR